MSLAAFIWASNLPLEVVGATPFRALLKYADRADEHGRTAWYTTDGLASALGCSRRTAQRALRELLDSGLLVEGDQRFTQHIRGGNRPVVYDLAMRVAAPARFDLGDTTPVDTPQSDRGVTPVDTSQSDRGVTPSDTSQGSGGVNSVRRGVSPVVAHRTVSEPYIDLGSTQGRSGGVNSVTPRIPKFDPSTQPPRQPDVSPEQQQANAIAKELPCTEGFGTGSGRFHLIPVRTGEGCARCGRDTQAILDEAGAVA